MTLHVSKIFLKTDFEIQFDLETEIVNKTIEETSPRCSEIKYEIGNQGIMLETFQVSNYISK